jgi:hypothetical protein
MEHHQGLWWAGVVLAGSAACASMYWALQPAEVREPVRVLAQRLPMPSAPSRPDMAAAHAPAMPWADAAARGRPSAETTGPDGRLTASRSARAPTTDNAAPTHDDASRAQALQTQRAEAQMRESAFRSEAIDAVWSRAAAASIQHLLSSIRADGVAPDDEANSLPTLRRMECHSQTCRVELALDAEAEGSDAIWRVASALGTQFTSITAAPADAGSGVTVLYLQ